MRGPAYETEGHGFESCRARSPKPLLTQAGVRGGDRRVPSSLVASLFVHSAQGFESQRAGPTP
jgi:hypothetical protein